MAHALAAEDKASLTAQVAAATGLNPAACYQCGKCSAGCPMASEMTLRPHQMLRLVQLDRRDRLFEDDSMWLCLTCETCSARCPNGVEPARQIDALREFALRTGAGAPPRRIGAFHRAFLNQIRSHGRVFELGLVASFKLRSGALFADVTSAPGMFARGKLALAPRTVDGIAEVRAIFDACAAAAAAESDSAAAAAGATGAHGHGHAPAPKEAP